MTHAAEVSPTGQIPSQIRGALSSRTDQALSALALRTAHSWMMALDRAKVLPEFGISHAAPLDTTSLKLFIKAGAGAHVTDMDGTQYLDLCLSGGAQVLGHAHPVVQQAIVGQCARGWHFDLPGDGQLELARLIQSAGAANERVALCSSGGAAAAAATAMARSFTGKAAVATFTGAFTRKGESAQAVLPYGHPAALDQIRKRAHDLAAVMVEPVRASDPSLERALWLQELSIACREAGVLLIFDERQTGFRLAYGGAQEAFGLMPDLAIYGKTIGGGLPSGAVAGRADVMAKLGDMKSADNPSAPRGPGISSLSVTAGIAALGYLHANRAALYPALNASGRHLAEQFNAFARGERMPVEMRCAGSMFRISFGASLGGAQNGDPAPSFRTAEAAYSVLVLSRGVMTLPGHRGFISTAHTGTDVEHAREALTQSLIDLRDDGLFGQA